MPDNTTKNLPLLRAVKEGKMDVIKKLLESDDVDVNFQNHCACPVARRLSHVPERDACSVGRLPSAPVSPCPEECPEHSSDQPSLAHRADGDTALILAAWYGHVDITRVLIEAGSDVDATNCDGNCALNCSAYHGFLDVATQLIQASATVDVRDNVTGKTALIKAAYVGHADVAAELIRAGADKNAVDNQGYSALAFSTSFNHIEVLEQLLLAKADPNVQDEFGITPLIHSAARGYADAVEMLLKAGAKPGLMDMEGKNALDYAESAEFEDVVAMLAACDEGPSMCSTVRDGTEPSLSARTGQLSNRGGSAAVMPSLSHRDNSGGSTSRMTPRVPQQGQVCTRHCPTQHAYAHHGAIHPRPPQTGEQSADAAPESTFVAPRQPPGRRPRQAAE